MLRLNTRIGGSDSTPTTAFAGPRRCRFRTDRVTRSHRWDVAAPSPLRSCTPCRRRNLYWRMTAGQDGVVDTDLKFLAYDNLYACDNSVFPVSPANPSLTLAALALRLAQKLTA
jgi:GMC oxidoreductase